MLQDDRQQLKDLAKQLLKIAGDEDCEWFDRDEMSQDDLDRIKENGSDNNFNDKDGALLFRTMWQILKELKELRREVRLNGTPISPLTSPDIQPPDIQPYTPYVPYPSTPSAPNPWHPNPWQVWYGSPSYSSPGTGDLFGPVTCTYTDTEGHKFEIDPTVPATMTYTYQIGNDCGCGDTNPFGHSYSFQSNSNPLEQ